MKPSTFLLAGLLLATPLVQARQAEDPIDAEQLRCIDEDSSTHGAIACAERAYGQWDARLNAAYKALMAALAPEDRSALRKAENAWIAFRDAEFSLLEAYYARKEGTMFLPMQADARVRIVKARVLELENHLDTLKID